MHEILNKLIDPKYTLKQNLNIPTRYYIHIQNGPIYIGYLDHKTEHTRLLTWDISKDNYTIHIIPYNDPDYQTKINLILTQQTPNTPNTPNTSFPTKTT